ncbi:MAG: hypothetical protein PHF29_09260 [Candidatus Riflebacteria bacterium]|nr:hypothetical protein [Candidatus Riflebacteria bacterium]
MRKYELMAKIGEAADRQIKIILDLDGSDNPQVIEIRKRAEAKKEAFEAVLLAMHGNSVYLDIEAGY